MSGNFYQMDQSLSQISQSNEIESELREKIRILEHDLYAAHQQLHAITNSRSWGVTLPLRYTALFLRHIRRYLQNLVYYIPSFFKKNILRMVSKLQNSPRLRALILKRLARHPKLRAYLRQLNAYLDTSAQKNSYRMSAALKNNSDYSPNALRIQVEFSALLSEKEKIHAYSD